MFKMGCSMARKILAIDGKASSSSTSDEGASSLSKKSKDKQVPSNKSSNAAAAGGNKKTGEDLSDFSKLEQDPRIPLNVRQIFKITKSWKAIARTMSKTGTAMFLNLFEQNQDLFHLFDRFQHLKGTELHESMELREHAATVMATLDQSINSLSDYDNFVCYLHSIGKLHRKVPGFQRAHFWKIEQPFMKAVKQTLDERCNETIEEIYKIAIKLIIETIADGYGADEPSDGKENSNSSQRDNNANGSNSNNNNNNNSQEPSGRSKQSNSDASGTGASLGLGANLNSQAPGSSAGDNLARLETATPGGILYENRVKFNATKTETQTKFQQALRMHNISSTSSSSPGKTIDQELRVAMKDKGAEVVSGRDGRVSRATRMAKAARDRLKLKEMKFLATKRIRPKYPSPSSGETRNVAKSVGGQVNLNTNQTCQPEATTPSAGTMTTAHTRLPHMGHFECSHLKHPSLIGANSLASKGCETSNQRLGDTLFVLRELLLALTKTTSSTRDSTSNIGTHDEGIRVSEVKRGANQSRDSIKCLNPIVSSNSGGQTKRSLIDNFDHLHQEESRDQMHLFEGNFDTNRSEQNRAKDDNGMHDDNDICKTLRCPNGITQTRRANQSELNSGRKEEQRNQTVVGCVSHDDDTELNNKELSGEPDQHSTSRDRQWKCLEVSSLNGDIGQISAIESKHKPSTDKKAIGCPVSLAMSPTCDLFYGLDSSKQPLGYCKGISLRRLTETQASGPRSKASSTSEACVLMPLGQSVVCADHQTDGQPLTNRTIAQDSDSTISYCDSSPGSSHKTAAKSLRDRVETNIERSDCADDELSGELMVEQRPESFHLSITCPRPVHIKDYQVDSQEQFVNQLANANRQTQLASVASSCPKTNRLGLDMLGHEGEDKPKYVRATDRDNNIYSNGSQNRARKAETTQLSSGGSIKTLLSIEPGDLIELVKLLMLTLKSRQRTCQSQQYAN